MLPVRTLTINDTYGGKSKESVAKFQVSVTNNGVWTNRVSAKNNLKSGRLGEDAVNFTSRQIHITQNILRSRPDHRSAKMIVCFLLMMNPNPHKRLVKLDEFEFPELNIPPLKGCLSSRNGVLSSRDGILSSQSGFNNNGADPGYTLDEADRFRVFLINYLQAFFERYFGATCCSIHSEIM